MTRGGDPRSVTAIDLSLPQLAVCELKAAGLLTLLGAWGISRIVVDTYSIDFFRASHPVRVDSDAIEATYGRYMPPEFTVTIAAVVIGIVVDDTIHFLHRFRHELSGCGDYAEAALSTLATAGPALVGTSLILAGGFLVLALASVKSIVFFGLLSAVAMVSALVADLVVLPALLVAVRPRLR